MKKHTLLLACAMRILLNLIALPEGGKQVATTLILTAFLCRLKVLFIEIRNTSVSVS